MNKVKLFFKRLWHRVLNPSIVQASIATVVGCIFIAAAIVISMSGVHDVGAYVCYALSLAALLYIGYIIFYGFPRVKQRTIEFASRYEFTDSLIKNYGYRTMAITCFSIALNAIYAVYNGAIAAHYLSWGNMLVALYYLSLCALRSGMIVGTRNNGRATSADERRMKSIKIYFSCGILLIVFTLLIVASMIILTVFDNESRSQYLIAGSGIYTFIRFIFSLYNIGRARKYRDFSTKALRNIGFADALVALYSLQVSLLGAYGDETAVTLSGAVSGTLVCVIIIFMGIYMIISGRRAMNNGV